MNNSSISTRSRTVPPVLAWIASVVFCSWLLSAIGGATTAPGSAQEVPPVTGSTPDINAAASTPATREAEQLRDITRLLQTRPGEAARVLKAIKPEELAESSVTRYYLLASRAALRTGDRAWLEELVREEASLKDSPNDLLILAAMRSLLAADFKAARESLERVQNPEYLGEIPRRRYLQLWQKLEQMENKPQAERVYADKLVTFVAQWPSANCQSCHANPKKYGDAVTSIDLQNLWFGERYSALLKTMGDAAQVRDAAQKTLQQKPDDAEARIRLAYALRALGDEDGGQRELRKIPWSQWSDRESKTPMRFGTFP